MGAELRQSLRAGQHDVFEPPRSAAELRASRVDTPDEPVGATIQEHDDIFEDFALPRYALGMDDRLAVVAVGLTQPYARRRYGEQAGSPAQMLGFELLEARHRDRGERIEDGGDKDTEQHRDEQGGHEELPDRDAGGASNDQFLRAGQAQERQHAPEQGRERKYFLRHERHLEQRHLEQHAECCRLPARTAAQQLDKVEQHHKGEQHGQRDSDTDEKLTAEIHQKRG